MDAFHERLAKVGLDALAGEGFALAGGYAVQAHGILERRSDDVDLFATMAAEASFTRCVQRAVLAYRADGLEVEVLVETTTFARLGVTDLSGGHASKVELGLDWREHPPAVLSIGPVLARDDAVANKVCALYSRGQARDYIDVDAARRFGYASAELMSLAAEHDPGFDTLVFVQALRAVRRLPVKEFTAYGLSEEAAVALVGRVLEWADDLDPRRGAAQSTPTDS